MIDHSFINSLRQLCDIFVFIINSCAIIAIECPYHCFSHYYHFPFHPNIILRSSDVFQGPFSYSLLTWDDISLKVGVCIRTPRLICLSDWNLNWRKHIIMYEWVFYVIIKVPDKRLLSLYFWKSAHLSYRKQSARVQFIWRTVAGNVFNLKYWFVISICFLIIIFIYLLLNGTSV